MALIKPALATLWHRKFLIVSGAICGLVAGGAYLTTTTPKYTSTMLIAASTHGVSSISESLGRNIPLASTLFGSAANPDFTRILALLHSEDMAATLQADYLILQQLHPGQWDAETKMWRQPNGLLSRLSQYLNGIFGRPKWQPPSGDTLAKELSKAIKITQSDNKGVYIVSFSANDPMLAHDVLKESFTEAEKIARQGALKAASAYVSYLENEMQFATNIETRKGLTDLYVQQEQRKMTLSADLPFAADIVNAPTVPQRPDGLSPLLLLVASMVGGAAVFFGIGVYRPTPAQNDAPDNLLSSRNQSATAAPHGL
jgi:uncharacterized protein involved in exopolysaccharide biosynthesis